MSSKRSLIGPLILPLFLVGLLILFVVFLRKRTSSRIITEVINKSRFKSLAPYWVAVSQLETGNFTSPLFKKNNNGFGFTYTVNDPYNDGWTPGTVPEVKWAKYKSLGDSARAIVDYMERKQYPESFPSVTQFVAFMKSKDYFAENEAEYLAGVKSYL